MKFTPLSEDEIQEIGLMSPDTYDFQILEAIEKVSSKGNDMIELRVNVFDKTGNPRNIRDWIMPSYIKKFKHAIDACGLVAQYEKGEILPEDFVGKTGKLKINIGSYTNNEGIEIKTNRIDDYVKRPAGFVEVARVLDGDECPF